MFLKEIGEDTGKAQPNHQTSPALQTRRNFQKQWERPAQPSSPANNVFFLPDSSVSLGKPGGKGLGSQQGSQPFLAPRGFFDFRSCESSRKDLACQCSRLGASNNSAMTKHIRWSVLQARDLRTLLGLPLSRSLNLSGQVCLLETCKCHQPGVADAQRRPGTDIHLVMG